MAISATRIAGVVPLNQQGRLDSALFEKQRPGATEILDTSQKQRITRGWRPK